MNAGTVAAIFAGATFLLTLFGVVFIGGKLSQTVEDHGIQLGQHGTELSDHRARIGKSELEIFGLLRWHAGYDARKNETRDSEKIG